MTITYEITEKGKEELNNPDSVYNKSVERKYGKRGLEIIRQTIEEILEKGDLNGNVR